MTIIETCCCGARFEVTTTLVCLANDCHFAQAKFHKKHKDCKQPPPVKATSDEAATPTQVTDSTLNKKDE